MQVINQLLKTSIVGSLDQFHLLEKMIGNNSHLSLLGYFNLHENKELFTQDTTGVLKSLYAKTDVVIWADANISQEAYYLIENLIRHGKHILFSTIPYMSVSRAKKIRDLQWESNTCIQFGLMQRNMPLFVAACNDMNRINQIKIDVNLSENIDITKTIWNKLAGDIDLVLKTVQSDIKSIKTYTDYILNEHLDLLNVRIEFNNGVVADINHSATDEQEKGIYKFYQHGKSIVIDTEQNTVVERKTENSQNKQLSIEEILDEHGKAFFTQEKSIIPFDPWRKEIDNFMENIQFRLTPRASIDDYIVLIDVIDEIIAEIN